MRLKQLSILFLLVLIATTAWQLINSETNYKRWKIVAQKTYQLSTELEKSNIDWLKVQKLFGELRIGFKRTEAILWYLNRDFTSKYLNGAPLPKLEENAPQLSILQPQGLQPLEEYIAEKDKKATVFYLKKFNNRWLELEERFKSLDLTDRMLLEALRQEVLRIAFLDLTGFENPSFTDALEETKTALSTLQYQIALISIKVDNPEIIEQLKELESASESYFFNTSFNDFNRIDFTRNIIQPYYSLLLDIQQYLKIETYYEVNTLPLAYNDQEKLIFSDAFLDPYFFTSLHATEDSKNLVSLGKTLFFDPVLSSNNKRSCASCHQPQKAFADGLPKSIAFDFEGTVERNSPGLINSVYSMSFFHDMRATPLETQFEHVIFSDKEFNTNYNAIILNLRESEEYQKLFNNAYGTNALINKHTVSTAIASYVASLRSYNSPIDLYLRGETENLDEATKRGYNLFMGKAACGTCHFPPTFAGLVPPFFDESESEIVGTPATKDIKNLDDDIGRAGGVLKQSANIYEHSFKTPTVRNIELTGPYMHNGVFNTLEEVVDFYNNGGGIGHGYDVPFQTLPSDSLHLTDTDKQDLILFMKALTDTTGLTSKPLKLPQFLDPSLNNRVIGGEY